MGDAEEAGAPFPEVDAAQTEVIVEQAGVFQAGIGIQHPHAAEAGGFEGDAGGFEEGVEAGAKLVELIGDGGLLVTINRFPYPQQQLPRLDTVFGRLGLNFSTGDFPETVRIPELEKQSELPIRVYSRRSQIS